MANEKSTTTPNAEDILFQNGGTPVSQQIDDVFKVSGTGSIDSAIANNYWGINHRQQPGAISINKDLFGLTFFTRPNMNLSSENIRSVRKLAPMVNSNSTSTQRIIRSYLDPTLAWRNLADGSPLVDSQQAFIPLLTNNLISMSGWPDITLDSYSSQEGIYREVWGMGDSVVRNYSTYGITANFRNITGDPITPLFDHWLTYIDRVYIGEIVPYPDVLLRNEIDYQTRIYRLVLDETKRFVTKIGACGACYPDQLPLGAAFNFESDRPINDASHQISINFKAFGAMYNDDILIDEFNRTTQMFCEGLTDRYRDQYFKKLSYDEVVAFNNRGYPRINPANMELEWYVTKEDYAERYPYLTQMQQNSGAVNK